MTSVASWPTPQAGVPTYGVIGWPVEHSLSPAIHEAAYRAVGLRCDYVRLPVAPGEMSEALARLVDAGFSGANVTMPHKEEAARGSSTRSPDVQRLGAANTLVISDGQVAAHNTDVSGFAGFLHHEARWDPSGGRALIFGAGGAARACALALSRLGLGELAVAVRDPGRAATIGSCVDAPTRLSIVPMADAPAIETDLVLNATPLGVNGERLPLPRMGAETLAVDLLYHPASTPFLAEATRSGAQAFGGLGLLIHQAADAFTIWTEMPAPLEAMWEAVRAPGSA